jgi:hypothetical protein
VATDLTRAFGPVMPLAITREVLLTGMASRGLGRCV